ncbi:MAG: hypothetical protein K2I78_01975, partial [Clostridia bacterium]|nr:hypothetical protein [Clostridia bacterium]MDE7215828.1 hypothetical protein [Clostridia bacterium]
MDIRKRKIKGIFVLSVLVILCLCVASVLSMFALDRKAEAVSSGVTTTNIGELLVDNYATRADKMVFNGSNLELLYKQMTGIPNASYDDVVTAAKEKKTSADFRSTKNTQTGGKLITIIIDGIVWNAVYLSTNNSGEPILTLWQANSSVMAKWNYHADDANTTIPSNMYGTSMIRNITLNAGGTYYTSNTGSGATTVPQDSNNTYAKFTMDSVTGSLTAFIDKPANVSWQADEISHKVNNYPYDFNNDAYGDVGSSVKMYAGMVNFYGKTDYSAWANDYIWLPSMTEAGWAEDTYIAKGIWDTSASERGNAGGDSWLRSAGGNYSHAFSLLANGSNNIYEAATNSLAVRPAFHLNLKKAEEASNAIAVPPETLESVYDTNVVDLTSESWYSDNIK